jgi:hypothetical protein
LLTEEPGIVQWLTFLSKTKARADTEFSSPSMAGAVICGGHVNGLTFWRNKDGCNLKEIEGSD